MISWQRARPASPRERRYRQALSLWITAGLAAILVSAVIQPRPLLVYNPSPSVRVGFYRIDAPGNPRRGGLVLARLPDDMRKLADQRRYVPATVPVLKVVAALSGDEVCAETGRIRINGQEVGIRQRLDRNGRPMPWWTGCVRLQSNEVFLLNGMSPHSFDGRYFGITDRASIIGKAFPL
jgi:conjugative transfer signal peptidase TraF